MLDASPIFIVDQVYYDFNALILSSLFLFAFSYIFSAVIFRSYIKAYFISFFKTIIFFVFFAFFFNEHNFNFPDSVKYLEDVVYLTVEFSFIQILLDPGIVMRLSGGNTLYYYWSFLAVELLGPYLFAPVVFNIIATFVGAWFVKNILSRFFFQNDMISSSAAIFYLFYWDILPWSSFFNLRDILIQVSILAVVFYSLKLYYEKSFIGVSQVIMSLIVLSYLRIHVSVLFVSLMLGGATFYSLFIMRASTLHVYVYKIIMPVLLAYFLYDNSSLISHAYNLWVQGLNVQYGYSYLRFLFSPLPSLNMLSHGYGFMFFSSILNIAFSPLALWGGYHLYRSNKESMVLILVFIIAILVLIGSYSNVQGPRQRLMLSPFIGIFVYYGCIKILYAAESRYLDSYNKS